MSNENKSENPKVTAVATADFWDHHNGLERKKDQEFVLRQSALDEYEEQGWVKRAQTTEKPNIKRGRKKNSNAGPTSKKR